MLSDKMCGACPQDSDNETLECRVGAVGLLKWSWTGLESDDYDPSYLKYQHPLIVLLICKICKKDQLQFFFFFCLIYTWTVLLTFVQLILFRSHGTRNNISPRNESSSLIKFHLSPFYFNINEGFSKRQKPQPVNGNK